MQRWSVVVVTAALLSGVLAAPAMAACGVGDTCTAVPSTAVQFTVSTGFLTIQAQAASAVPGPSAVLGANGAVATVPLGQTTVTDSRLSPAGWSMTATASAFTSGSFTIPAANASFSVVAASPFPTPSGTTLPTFSLAPITTVTNSVAGALTLMTATAGGTNHGIIFTPVLTVAVPTNAIAGTYAGTVTQSLS